MTACYSQPLVTGGFDTSSREGVGAKILMSRSFRVILLGIESGP